jgi:hypothetical protein
MKMPASRPFAKSAPKRGVAPSQLRASSSSSSFSFTVHWNALSMPSAIDGVRGRLGMLVSSSAISLPAP